MDRSSNGYN